MYRLYGGGYSRSHLTEMVMAELDVRFTLVPVDIARGEHKTPEYRAINPAGWVPVLITPDGETIYETPAINLYLIERHGPGRLAPTPDEPDRGVFLSGLFFLTGELEPALKRYFFPHRYGVRRKEDAEGIRQMAFEAVCKNLEIIDERLAAAGPYHLGGRYSLVDLTLCYWVRSIMDQKSAAQFEAIDHCLDLVRKRPRITGLFQDHEARFAKFG